MIIDEQVNFRDLLMHHVTTHWLDAIISAYDSTSAGHLSDEFNGAGSDIILLGSRYGEDRDRVDVLEQFMKRDNFLPVIYLGTAEDEHAAKKLRPDAHFMRDGMPHNSLVVSLAMPYCPINVSSQRVLSSLAICAVAFTR